MQSVKRRREVSDGDLFLKQLPVDDGTIQKLLNEQIDKESFLLLSDADMKEIGIPLGPRKILLRVIEEKAAAGKKARSQTSPVVSAVSSALSVSDDNDIPPRQPPPAMDDTVGTEGMTVEEGESDVEYTPVQFRCVEDEGPPPDMARVVRIRWDGPAPDGRAVRMLLGKELVGKLQEHRAINFAYDQDTLDFRNLVYLSFQSHDAAKQAVAHLQQTVVLSHSDVPSKKRSLDVALVARAPFPFKAHAQGEKGSKGGFGGKKGGRKGGKKGRKGGAKGGGGE